MSVYEQGMMEDYRVREALSAEARRIGRKWGWFLAAGIAWIIFAFVVLSFDFTTVWAVAIFAGASFIAGGVVELLVAGTTKSWRWLHVLLGATAVVAGILALMWPEQTFIVLAAIVGWFIAITGLIDIVLAIASKEEDDLWWMRLIAGLLGVGIGFWAVAGDGSLPVGNATVSTREILLLVVWVAATAMVRGISNILTAFRLRSIKKRFS